MPRYTITSKPLTQTPRTVSVHANVKLPENAEPNAYLEFVTNYQPSKTPTRMVLASTWNPTIKQKIRVLVPRGDLHLRGSDVEQLQEEIDLLVGVRNLRLTNPPQRSEILTLLNGIYGRDPNHWSVSAGSHPLRGPTGSPIIVIRVPPPGLDEDPDGWVNHMSKWALVEADGIPQPASLVSAMPSTVSYEEWEVRAIVVTPRDAAHPSLRPARESRARRKILASTSQSSCVARAVACGEQTQTASAQRV